PLEGTVLITVADKDKEAAVDVARCFADLGFSLKTTSGTQSFLSKHGIQSEGVYKMREKRPHIADAIMDGQIQLVINTPRGKASKTDDSYIRKAAIRYKIPYITTIAAASAAAKGIAAYRKGRSAVRSLQSYHADIK
ncbi:carbamoyl phosphate synthase large subunit, partial [Verrucomicrobiota bacterium]